jgi:hypothetical protein
MERAAKKDDKKTLTEIRKKAEKMVVAAKKSRYKVAAANLEHYLNGTKHKKRISSKWLRSFSRVINAEEVNQNRFEEQLYKQAVRLRRDGRKKVRDYWESNIDYKGRGTSTEELFFASGNSHIKSAGHFKIVKKGEQIKITGEVTHDWKDRYDFHNGLFAYIPGFGMIPDSDMKRLATEGSAGEYNLRSKWKQKLKAQFNINERSNRIKWDWGKAR